MNKSTKQFTATTFAEVSSSFYQITFAINLCIALACLLLFTLVKVEKIYQFGIFPVSLTIAIACALAAWINSIVFTIEYGNTIYPSYSVAGRLLIYSFPQGRTQLFIFKHKKLLWGGFVAAFIGLLLPIGIYSLIINTDLVNLSSEVGEAASESASAGVKEELSVKFNPLFFLLSNAISCACAALISVSTAVISGIIGIIRNSRVTALILAVIIGVIAGNGFANSGARGWMLVIEVSTTVVFGIVAWSLFSYQAKRVLTEDVL